MTDEEIEQLGERQNDFKNAINKGNAMNIAETDEAFHDVIYLGTGNDKLVQILNNLREQMYRYLLPRPRTGMISSCSLIFLETVIS